VGEQRTQHALLHIDERVRDDVVRLGPCGVAVRDVEALEMENLAQRQLIAMRDHLGDRPELVLGLGGVAERPVPKQTERAEPDHRARELGLVFHRGTVLRSVIRRR
jgi:hypothetical protein